MGLKIDRRGLLYVAGGAVRHRPRGRLPDREILAATPLTTKPSFINDVVLTKRAAWFTNSLQAGALPAVAGGVDRQP